jgi:HEPN domain-containing protein
MRSVSAEAASSRGRFSHLDSAVDRLVEGLHPEKIILSGSHARGTHAKLLDRHYIPTRDPDALPDLTPRDAFGLTDATEAIPAARGILVSVEELLER